MQEKGTEQMQNEKDLLARLSQGDRRAFDLLYKLHSVRIYKNILRLVKQEELAEEILQDVFMKLWEKRETLTINISFKSYLFRIAQNLVMDNFRRLAFDRKLFDHLISVSTELHSSTDELIDLKGTQSLIDEAVESLSPQRKKVYLLCKIEGKSYDEVSGMLGISTSTISDHIVKATKAVREHLSDHEFILLLLATIAAKK